MRDTEDFLGLVEAHVIVWEEVYTLAQLHESYDVLKDNLSRNIDIKAIWIKRFGDRTKFGKPLKSVKISSEFAYSAVIDCTPATIHSAATGNVLEIYKNVALGISNEIQTDVINSDGDKHDVNAKIYNFLALIVNPHSFIDGTGTVRLSEFKAMKISEICHDIVTTLKLWCSHVIPAAFIFVENVQENRMSQCGHWHSWIWSWIRLYQCSVHSG